MTRKIVSISFLFDGERIRIGCDKNGKFPLPKIKKKGRLPGDAISYMHPHTAKEFIEHKRVIVSDPVLTLSDGTKLRVFLNGDPTGQVVEAISVIEKHDASHNTRKPRRFMNGNKKKRGGRASSFGIDSYCDYGYLDDYSYYDFDDDTD